MLSKNHDNICLHKSLDLIAVCPIGILLFVSQGCTNLFRKFNIFVIRIFKLEFFSYRNKDIVKCFFLIVLNDDNCLIGIVTVDDAVDVLTEEATEDLEAMNAVAPLEDGYLETSSWKMARKCVPWIIVLLILGTFSSMVLSIFQDQLAVLPILAAFVPVLMDTGGNAGGQTIAVMIRGLALKEFGPKQFWKIVGKEIRSALLISAFISLFAFAWFTIEQYTGIVHNTEADKAIGETFATIWTGGVWNWAFAMPVLKVSAIVAGTLFITTVVSKMVAVCLPFLAVVIKKDPAIVSQPILTTVIDVTSLLIFFGIAELLILRFL